MSGFAPAAPTDGLVQWELTIEEARTVARMLTVGAAAWEACPTKGAVEEAMRPRDVAEVRELRDEVARLGEAAHEAQQAAYRARAKARRRA